MEKYQRQKEEQELKNDVITIERNYTKLCEGGILAHIQTITEKFSAEEYKVQVNIYWQQNKQNKQNETIPFGYQKKVEAIFNMDYNMVREKTDKIANTAIQEMKNKLKEIQTKLNSPSEILDLNYNEFYAGL